MKTYILFVFASSSNQQKFIENLSEDIIGGSGEDIRYFYGDESVIFTFKSKQKQNDLIEYFEKTLGEFKLTFFMMPYDHDNMAFYLDEKIYKHLFLPDFLSEKHDKNDITKSEVDNLFSSFAYEDLDMTIDGLIEDCEDEFFKVKTEPKTLSLDDLLDKINYGGMSSLSEKELSLLKKYSN